ncbi:MAG: response regulator [Glaciecola sp.]|jgi:DNA-binding NarL/FixJ family response regulator
MPINIVLVDDHELVLNGFIQLIQSDDAFVVVDSFGSAEDALASDVITEDCILVTDISLPNKNGLELVKEIKKRVPLIKTVVLSMYENAHYIVTAQSLRVNAYISKRDAGDVLLDALHKVASGYTVHSPAVLESATQQSEEFELYQALTEREKEIFVLLAMGHEVKHVAHQLDIAVKTAHVHRRNILNKFNCTTGFQLTRFAIKYGLVDPAQL